jgi:hypothetical protein
MHSFVSEITIWHGYMVALARAGRYTAADCGNHASVADA